MANSRSTRVGLTLALAATATLAFGAAAAWAAHHEKAKPLVVKIHADWCGTCTRLNSTWEALQKEHGDGVQFVILDVTDRKATSRSQQMAESLGIVAIFDQYKSKTGTIAVVDGSTLQPVEVLKGEFDVAKYRPAIEKALGT